MSDPVARFMQLSPKIKIMSKETVHTTDLPNQPDIGPLTNAGAIFHLVPLDQRVSLILLGGDVRRALLIRSVLGLAGLTIAAVAVNVGSHVAGHAVNGYIVTASTVVALVVALWSLAINDSPRLPPTEAQQREAARRIRFRVEALLESAYQMRLDQPVRMLSINEAMSWRSGELEYLDTGRPTTLSAFVSGLIDGPTFTMVIGNSGAGKSTVIMDLAARVLRQERHVSSVRYALPVWLGSWRPGDSPFSRWVSDTAAAEFRISRRVTYHWMNRGSCVVLLDGLDEVPDDARANLVSDINLWVRSAAGTRLVVTSRPSTYVKIARLVKVDQVAALLPLSPEEVQRQFSRMLVSDRANATAAVLRGLLGDHSSDASLRLPAFLDVLGKSLSQGAEDARATSQDSDDPGAAAFFLGNRFMAEHDWHAARDAYLAAMDATGSVWRAPAAVRLSACLRQLGENASARKALLESVSLRLEDSIFPPIGAPDVTDLSEDERRVLAAMQPNVTYDEGQVTGAARLIPSRTAAILKQLRMRGLVEPTEDTGGGVRFLRAPSYS